MSARRTLDVGACGGLWRHCAYKCDLTCDHDVWCADCERKYGEWTPYSKLNPPTLWRSLVQKLRG